MATPSQIAELRTKVTALVRRQFGGSWPNAFRAYDSNGDGLLRAADLDRLFEDADVGSFLTRSAWVDGVLHAVDANHDQGISLNELQGLLSRSSAPAQSAQPAQGTPRPDYLFPADYPADFTPAHPNPPKKPKPKPKPKDDTMLLIGVAAFVAAALYLAVRK